MTASRNRCVPFGVFSTYFDVWHSTVLLLRRFCRLLFTFRLADLIDSVLCNQYQAESCFTVHHAVVSVSSLFKRSCFDHRSYILQDAEGQGVLAINRRAG